jgi:hypothetical protein
LRGGAGIKISERSQSFARGNFLVLGGADFGEFVGHWLASSVALWGLSSDLVSPKDPKRPRLAAKPIMIWKVRL